ncbi:MULTISPECIES: single-stranded DNA-binding protein [Chryseobacterium]|uniref:Single-stranded DNA-binding protein n=1 Tax=Chryseobacterium aquifrigidense TaxID=558021 RepID=A0A543EHF3_9FLAO|nr:single-stranded DNA-binding protein [Chryseobacterium aquifrigidense]TQM21018.1 single-strand DNA-binding protein [Chryseobacterium aquifrigidense]
MNIIGRLTRDAEVRTLSNKKQVVNFSIATNDNYRNKQGERIEQTTFFDCSYWITSKVAELLTKGTLVELMGRVYTRAWIGKDGEAHAGLNFHTSKIKIHSISKTKPEKETTSKEPKSNQNDKDDDLPF